MWPGITTAMKGALLALVLPLSLVALACGGDDAADSAATIATSVPADTATTASVVDIAALAALPDVELTIVAPAENQSGTSMNLTEGELVAVDATTASGIEATAVAGFPADSVRRALENLDVEFDLVVSGSNSGQNIGDFSTLSGTVGAARYGAQQGVPALAVSQGLVAEGDIVFDDSVDAAIAWITDNRAAYETGTVTLTSINAPTCPGGARGVVQVPLGAFEGRDPFVVDCASTLEAPVDDVEALVNGFTAITDLPVVV
jgi:5'-nucleotidase